MIPKYTSIRRHGIASKYIQLALVSLKLQHDYETDQLHLKRNSSQSGVARLLELPIYEKLRRADALPSSESSYPESILSEN
tara:strand:+ start:49942 stop:50184 length:243 start_codon:yes stop_codon:yes gene_type:complete